MSWRAPRFGILHKLRDRGVGDISIANALTSGDFKTYWLDGRRELATFNASETDHYIQVDCGVGYAQLPVDRFWIPSGHNMNGWTLRLRESSTSDFSADIVTLFSDSVGGADIDEDMDQASTKRYIRLDWNTADKQPSLGEFWMTKTMTPQQGFSNKTWRDDYLHNVHSFITPAGDRGDLIVGGKQRVFAFDYVKIDHAATIAILDDLVWWIGMSEPFLFDPPFDNEDAIVCKMLTPPTRKYDSPVQTPTYSYHFELVEQIV